MGLIRLPLYVSSPAIAGHWRFSRIPVCKDTHPDTIVGVVHRRDVYRELLLGKGEATMADLMIPVKFVRDDMPANSLLNFFLKKRTQIACVQDAQGKL